MRQGEAAGRSVTRGLAVMAVTAVMALGGCAFSNLNVFPPRGPVGSQVTGGGGRALMVTSFVDQRAQRHRCGMQKNGYNMDTANVYCTVDPTQSLAQLLVTELRAAGFAVNDGPPGPDTVRIDGQLLQYFIEPAVGFFTFTPEADISVRLIASSPSGLLADREFYVKAEEVSMVGTESNFQVANETATRQVIGQMTAAVVALLNRYPSLGARGGVPPAYPPAGAPPPAPPPGAAAPAPRPVS